MGIFIFLGCIQFFWISLFLRVIFLVQGITAIVSVDDRGSLTIPKELGVRGTRVIIIPAGSFFVTIPLPDIPLEIAEGWLKTDKTRKMLKESAEEGCG